MMDRRETSPQFAERGHGMIVFIAIQGEAQLFALSRMSSTMRCNPRPAFLDIAAELDFEMRKPVHANELLEGLRQAVIHAVRCIDIDIGQRIGQSHRVPHDDDRGDCGIRRSAGVAEASSG